MDKIVVEDEIKKRLKNNDFYRTYIPNMAKLNVLETDFDKMRRLVQHHNTKSQSTTNKTTRNTRNTAQYIMDRYLYTRDMSRSVQF